jgi:Phosphate-selective porin O and P
MKINTLIRGTSVFVLPLLGTLGLSPKLLAQTPTTQSTNDRIDQLQARVDQLEAQRAQQSPTTTPAPAGPSLVQTTWDGNRLQISAFDGNFTFHPSLTIDIRDMLTYRERIPAKGGGETNSTGYDTQNGFDVSRARFVIDGTLFKQVGYFVQASADQGSSFGILDAYATYRFGTSPFTIKAGQFKDPIWHERNISEANLMGVDRSLQEYFLEGGQGSRVQGASLMYEQDQLRAQLVAHDGFNTQNTKFYDAGGNASGVGGESGVTPTNFGFSTREEYMLIGHHDGSFNPWAEYDQFSSLNAKQNILVVGAGADFSQASDNDLLVHSADIQFNSPCGFSAYAAYTGTYRSILTNQGVPHGHYYDSSFLVQAAYLIDQKFEPYIRYDWVKLDPASTFAVSGINSHLIQELTLGANYYIYGQKLKLTVDGSWLPNGSPGDADALGVLRDSGRYEFMLRTQLQLSI